MSEAQKQEKKSTPKPMPRKTRFYTLFVTIARAVVHTICPVRYHHRERLEGLEPPYMLIGNHQAWADPVVMAVPVKKEQVSFLGKKELASNRLMAWFLRHLHMIPVDRHNMDMAAMRACMKVLRDGGVLGIFP